MRPRHRSLWGHRAVTSPPRAAPAGAQQRAQSGDYPTCRVDEHGRQPPESEIRRNEDGDVFRSKRSWCWWPCGSAARPRLASAGGDALPIGLTAALAGVANVLTPAYVGQRPSSRLWTRTDWEGVLTTGHPAEPPCSGQQSRSASGSHSASSSMTLIRGQNNSSVKGQVVNVVGFANH